MASYPTLSSGRTFLAPLARTTRYPVKVLTFGDGSEQRWRVAPPLERFSLRHDGITTTDRDALFSFFAGRKGDYDEFDLTMDGATYDHLKLDSPEITARQRPDHLWDVALTLRQWSAA